MLATRNVRDVVCGGMAAGTVYQLRPVLLLLRSAGIQ